ALLGDFADVQQTVGTGKEFDESTEFRQAYHFAEIGLADLSASSHVANHLKSGVAARTAGGKDMNRTVFVDVDLHAGCFDDRLDLLATRTDQIADLVGRNGEFEQARRVS